MFSLLKKILNFIFFSSHFQYANSRRPSGLKATVSKDVRFPDYSSNILWLFVWTVFGESYSLTICKICIMPPSKLNLIVQKWQGSTGISSQRGPHSVLHRSVLHQEYCVSPKFSRIWGSVGWRAVDWNNAYTTPLLGLWRSKTWVICSLFLKSWYWRCYPGTHLLLYRDLHDIFGRMKTVISQLLSFSSEFSCFSSISVTSQELGKQFSNKNKTLLSNGQVDFNEERAGPLVA